MTREYRRFVEFCDACRQARYIGLCYGVPGVGKTVSARQYAHWDELESVLGPAPHRHDGIPPPDSGPWRTVLYTPAVVNTPRIVERDVAGLWRAVAGLADRALRYSHPPLRPTPPDLVIVDEADRLKTGALEQLRDTYDRRTIGLVLIGMPGLQKRLARYAQLYSRVGFVHQFQPLSGREFQTVVERQWVQLGLDSMTLAGPDTELLNTDRSRDRWKLPPHPALAGSDRAAAGSQQHGRGHPRRGRRGTREPGGQQHHLTVSYPRQLPRQ